MVEQLVKAYQDGASAQELAALFNLSTPSILRRLRDAGCQIRTASLSQKLRYKKYEHPSLGMKHTEATKQKMRANHADFSGDKNPNYGKGLFGPKNPNWKGGVTEESNRGRNTDADMRWKELVLHRDKHACQLCFKGKSDLPLCVHHIRNWRTHPELRRDPNNGVVLCLACHCSISHADRELLYIQQLEEIVAKNKAAAEIG